MSYTRRLEYQVTGTTSGFDAAMNRVNAGLTRVSGGLRQGSRDAGVFSNQIKAIGTTARYYLAGRLVFGIQSAISNLGDFKTQLGEVDALAAQLNRRGQLVGLGNQLNDVGSEALLMSNRFGIAVGDVESYMQRFFSSFNPPGTAKQRVQEMNSYVNAILNLSASLGTEAGDPQKLAGGLTGLINALPGGRRHPGRAAKTISDYFATLLRETPSLTGADIATAAGRFASAASLSRMSVPEILSTFGVAAQTGGSPAVIIRGITQLLGQSLLHPTRPQSLRTYQAAGLPTDPNMLAQMGGQKVLERLITFVQQGGPPGSAGRRMNLDMIYNAFSRQESVRQFVNLIAQGGVPALRDFRKSLEAGTKENISQQMANRRLRQSTLIRMQQATRNLGVSLVGGADWPLEHLVADPIIGVSNFAARHRTTTQVAVGGALSLGAANALRRLGAFSRFGRLGKFLGTATGLEQAAIGGAIAKSELPAAIAGGAADGSRGNPYWVIISPLSWSIGQPGGFSMPVGGGGAASEERKALGIASRIWGKAKGIVTSGAGAAAALRGRAIIGAVGRNAVRLGPRVAGGVGLGLIMAGVFPDNAGHGVHIGMGDFDLQGRYPNVDFNRYPALHRIFSGNNLSRLPMAQQRQARGIFNRLFDKDISPQRAETLLEASLKRAINTGALQIAGYAKLDIDVNVPTADGGRQTTTKRGVPVKLWNAKQYPTNKGKPGSRAGKGK